MAGFDLGILMDLRRWFEKSKRSPQPSLKKTTRKPARNFLLESLEERWNPSSIPVFSAAGNLLAPSTLASVNSPVSIISGDFNQDGLPDLATANSFKNNISLLFSQGNGTFSAPQNITVNGNPQAIQSADFNGDGKLDLLTANYKSDTVSILFGNGNGTFQNPQTLNLPAGAGPRGLAVGDFNKDNALDFATANFEINSVTVFLGKGNGTFSSGSQISVGTNPISLVVGDFNRDGKPDLVSANPGSRDLTLLLGNGLGGFATGSTLIAGVDPEGISTGDFNQDGRSDLVTVDPSSNSVWLLVGDGSGGFFKAKPFAAGDQPGQLIVGDFTGDNLPDVVTTNPSGKTISLLPGLGNSTFAAPIAFGLDSNPISLVGKDFNSDGLADIVTANNPGNSLSFFGNSYFSTNVTFLVGNKGSFPFKAIGDPTPTFQITQGTLPGGVTLNQTTGVLSGTPNAGTAGSYSLVITASNSAGSADLPFTLKVNQAPLITSNKLTTFLAGQDSSFSFTAAGYPDPVFSLASGTLPQGITLDSATGILSGNPASGTGGIKKLVITASNGINPSASQNFDLTIQEQAAITSADNAAFTYGKAGSFKVTTTGYPLPTLTADGIPAGLDFDPVTGILSGKPNAIGTYFFNITASNGVGDDAVQSFSLTINPGDLVISVDNKKSSYGSALPDFTATFKGLAPWDQPDVVSGLVFDSTATSSSPVGNYTISGSGAQAANYNITYVDGTLSITPAILTITPANKSKVYGAPLPGLTATISGLVNGDPESIVTGLQLNTLATAKSKAGDYAITGSQASAPNYSVQYAQGTLSVTKAPLTITADNKNKLYGAGLPDFSAKFTGLVNGDTSSVVTGLTYGSTATVSSPVATYKITPSGAVAPDYAIKYVEGNLTVTKAPLTITADDKAKLVGEVNPTLTAQYKGLVNGDTAAVVSNLVIQTTATTTSPVGKYPITVSGATASNYTISFTAGNLQISEMPKFTSAASTTMSYGKAANFQFTATGQPAPAFSISQSDLPVGVSFNATKGLLSADGSTAPGTYQFTVTASNGLPTPTTQQFTLTVNKATLTITADNKSREYLSGNPALTATYSGFVLKDGPSSVNGLVLSTTADNNSPVGQYPITLSGATSAFYDITLVPGTLKVTPKALDFTPPVLTKKYGSSVNLNPFVSNPANQAGSAYYSAPVDITRFSTQFTFQTLALTPTPGDGFTFVIQNSGANALGKNGESLGYEGIAKSVAIKFDFFNNAGEGNNSIGVFLNGAKPTKPATSLDGTPIILGSDHTFLANLSYDGTTLKVKITDVETGLSASQDFPVNIASQVGANTALVGFTAGTGALNARQTVLDWSWLNQNGSKVFQLQDFSDPNAITINGSASPNGPELVLTGFGTAGEVSTGIGTDKLSVTLFSPGSDSASKAGSYPLVGILSGPNASSYTLNLKGSQLTVTKAPILVKANDAVKTYGSTPSFTGKEFTVTGDLFNGDKFTGVTLTSNASKANAGTGTQPIVPSNATGNGVDNYQITYGNGNYTVNPAQLTITPEYKSKPYGADLPPLTAAYFGLVAGDGPEAVTGLTLSTTATSLSEVGEYKITASNAKAANYSIQYGGVGILTVTRATVTISADNLNKVYGAALPNLTATFTGLVGSDSPSLFKGLSLVTNALPTSSVGTFKITPSSAVGPKNYFINYAEGTLTVTKAPLTVTVDNQTMVYGSKLPGLTSVTKGFVNGDNPANFTGVSVTTTATSTSPIGDYPITASGLNAPNYEVSYIPGRMSITKAALKIFSNARSKTYGEEVAFNGSEFTTLGLVGSDNVSSVKLTSSGSPKNSGVGTYMILISQEQGTGLGNYDISYSPGTLSVNRATLTIKPDDQKRIYGQQNPNFTASYSGLVNGDTPSVVFNLKLATTATASSAAGTYSITASGANSSNYSITYGTGNLTVDKAPLLITADNKTKTYGAPLPVLTSTMQGLVNSDTPSAISGLSLTTTALASSDTGTYEIKASKGSSPNYTISYASGTLSVTKAKLTVSADNKIKTYGNAPPTLTASFVGLVNGDSTNVVPGLTLSTTATTSSPVGSFPIRLQAGTPKNYDLEQKDGTLTVAPAVLIITAENKSKVYGDSLPVLTNTLSGLTNGDSPTVVSGLRMTTTGSSSSNVGTYSIIPSDATAPNYTIRFVNGSLAVTPAPLTIAADDKTKVYGDKLPTLTVSFNGLVNGDTPSGLSGLKITTTALATSKVGNYTITPSGVTSSNYAIQFAKGNLTVSRASLTIAAVNQSRKVGTANPVFTAKMTGLVNGDTAASIVGLVFGTDATVSSSPGTYSISPKGATNANYDITFADGILTVFQAPAFTNSAKVTLAAKSVQTFAFGVTGFPNPTFSLAKGTLPVGVTLNPVTGELNLSPATKAGVYSFSIKATNLGGSATQDFVLTLV